MVLLQKWPFFQFFFLGNIAPENVFYDILEQKKAVLGYKNKKFKKRKMDFFPKGLTHGFSPKMAIFPTFFFRQFSPGNCLLWYSRAKNAFLGIKNKKFKKSKNWHFSKGVNPVIWTKNGLSSKVFFFRQFWPQKCLLWYSRAIKRLSRLQKKEV